MKKLSFIPLIVGTFLFLTACKSEITEVTPGLSADVKDALQATITDEYKAQMTYQRILDDFGAETRPFVNIKQAEIKHAEAIANLMVKYGITVPENPFHVVDMPAFGSVKEACAVGVVAEEENIALYDTYLLLNLPADVRTVFENNKKASLNNHLPAFQNCSQ